MSKDITKQSIPMVILVKEEVVHGICNNTCLRELATSPENKGKISVWISDSL